MKTRLELVKEWNPPKTPDELAKVMDSCINVVVPLVREFKYDGSLFTQKLNKAFELLKFEAYNYKGPANLFKYHVSNVIRGNLLKTSGGLNDC